MLNQPNMHEQFLVEPGTYTDLQERSPDFVDPDLEKSDGKKSMKKNRDVIAALQDQFYADDHYSMLLGHTKNLHSR